jgi:hypothetical protein
MKAVANQAARLGGSSSLLKKVSFQERKVREGAVPPLVRNFGQAAERL